MMSGNYGGGSNLGEFLSGLFTDAGAPFGAGMNQYQNYFNQGIGAQNPFMKAGSGAIPQFQQWLQSMSNPSGFINGLMQNYQQSPWAKFSQQQGIRAANNLGSASGLTGSTPLQMQAQQNAQNISSQDMQNWLGNVLGVNQQYGSGLSSEMGMGANAADIISRLFGQGAQDTGGLAMGQRAGENQNWGNLIGGGLGMFLNGIFS